MQTYHLTWATVSRQPIFSTEAARRAALHALAAVAGAFIVLFAIVDDHLHLVIHVDPKKFGVVQRSLTKVLRRRAGAPLGRIDIRRVETRSHLNNLVGYCLKQPRHHGLRWDPATTTGSCFPDLVGARRIDGLTLPLSTVLPRFELRDAFAAVSLPGTRILPASDDALRALGPVRLAELTGDALACSTPFASNTPIDRRARRVFAALATAAGFTPRDIAHALTITHTAACRLAKLTVEPADEHVVRVRVSLETAAAARPIPEPAPNPRASVVSDPEPTFYQVFGQAD